MDLVALLDLLSKLDGVSLALGIVALVWDRKRMIKAYEAEVAEERARVERLTTLMMDINRELSRLDRTSMQSYSD